MGQKTNPKIFQLEKTNDWQSKYFEKKITESSIYSKKDIEIRNFIYKFFKDHKITVNNCRLYYLNKSLHIFISYYQNFDYFSLKTNNNETKKTNIKKSSTNCKFYEIKKLKNLIKKNSLSLTQNKLISKTLKSFKNNTNLKTKLFIKKLFEGLTIFTAKKSRIFLILQPLKYNLIKQITNKKVKDILKKKLGKLIKYQQNSFFKEGINILLICTSNKKSSKLLAQFIAVQLEKLKRHNFFFKFIKSTLMLFKNNSFLKFKGIKIIIKGRLNGRPRARNKIIKISDGVSVLTINSIIDYAEEIAFTPNGTIGIKVWIHES